MRLVAVVVVLLLACKKDKPEGEVAHAPDRRAATDERVKVEKPSTIEGPVAGRHVAPRGTIGGTPVAPNIVLLLDNSDGGKLAFHTASDQELTDRPRCDEPLGSANTFELARYEAIEAWKVGTPITSDLDGWSASGVAWDASRKGTATVTLSKKDPKTFSVAGTIELVSDIGTFSGAFEGEYCPTKAVKRDDKPPPLATRAWTMGPVPAVNDLPTTPAEAIVAGLPATIAAVTVREVTLLGGEKRQQFQFFTALPPDPCGVRPVAQHWHLRDPEAKAFRSDQFLIDLPAIPAAGSRLSGRYYRDDKKQDEILDAELQVNEPDRVRGWRYAQYYSAALAIDAVTDRDIRARVQLSLPDESKSMLVGSFTAMRCSPLH